jgi:pyruvate dehydrogenase E2 component (dihydrolipoamide acetyltransferase)
MATQVLVPVMGEAIGEARLAAWLKHVGDPVRRGDELAELETDKAVLMLECPADGVLLEILVAEGAMVTTGQMLAHVGRAGELVQPAPAEHVPDPAPDPAPDSVPARGRGSTESNGAGAVPAPAGERVRISPAARRMARDLGLDVSALNARLPGARITTRDVERLAAGAAAGSVPQRRVLFNEVQRVMATRMTQSVREIPQFSVAIETDATRLLQVKQDLSPKEAVSMTALLIYLAARVLRRHPMLNARFDGDGVVMFETVNMGVAVASPQGLVVPVLPGAEQLELATVARRLRDLVETAQRGRLALAQISGGTFTLSNLGMYGISQFVPLVNPPQAAILGVGGIQPAVLPTAGGTRYVQRLSITVSADHRVVDGAAAAFFLQDLQHAVEEAVVA